MKKVIVRIEPSKRLSALVGFPYFIERKFSIEELLEKHIITDADIVAMEQGREIMKMLKAV